MQTARQRGCYQKVTSKKLAPGPWGTHGSSPAHLQAHSQNSLWIRSQVCTDHWPFMSFLQCDSNSSTNISHKMSSMLPPLFKSSFTYPSFCSPPSYRQMLSLAGCVWLNSTPTSPAPGKSWVRPLPTPLLPGLGSACCLAPTPSQRGQTKGLYLAIATHLLIYTVFSFTVRYMQQILPVSKALTKLCSSDSPTVCSDTAFCSLPLLHQPRAVSIPLYPGPQNLCAN